MSGLDLAELRNRQHIAINTLDAHYFDDASAAKLLLRHFRVSSLIALGIDDRKKAALASGALLQYLYDTQKNSLSNVTGLTVYSAGRYMLLDSATRRNLELTETLREKQKRGSLRTGGHRAQVRRGPGTV